MSTPFWIVIYRAGSPPIRERADRRTVSEQQVVTFAHAAVQRFATRRGHFISPSIPRYDEMSRGTRRIFPTTRAARLAKKMKEWITSGRSLWMNRKSLYRTRISHFPDPLRVTTRTPRSEERRVGKECRSRW